MHFTNIVPKFDDICTLRTKCHPENVSFRTLTSTSSGAATLSTVKKDAGTSSSNVSGEENRNRTRFAPRLNTTKYSVDQTNSVQFVVCVQTERCDTVGSLFASDVFLPLWQEKSVYTHSSFGFGVLFPRVTLPVRLRAQYIRTRGDKIQDDILSLECMLLVRC